MGVFFLAMAAGCAAAAAPALTARLNPPASSGPCTVLEVDWSSMPAGAQWFRLRAADGGPMPVPMSGGGGKGLWFPRTDPKPAGQQPQGIQQYPFLATGVFNAGAVREIVPCNLTAPRTANAFVVEAWTDRNDLGDGAAAKLLASSAPMTFSFDDLGFSAGLKFDRFAVAASDTVPGLLTVTAQPTNATAFAMAKLISWYGFAPTGKTASNGMPSFQLDTDALGDAYPTRLFPTPTANLSYSGPGIHYAGIYGAWNGGYGFSSPKPQNGVRTYYSFPLDSAKGTSFQPLAVIVPFENGTKPSLPPGFAGPSFTAPAIPGDVRLALRVNRVTVFHGGSLHLPCVNGPKYPNGAAFAPDAVELEVPAGLVVLPPAAASAGVGYWNVTDVTGSPGGGATPPGYVRLRLVKPPKNEWSYLNGDVVIKTAVDGSAGIEGKTFPLARVRAYSGAANQARSDNWQPLAVTVAKLTPVPALPKRLRTSYCWAGWDELASSAEHGLDPVVTWRALGFNTVPTDGASFATPPGKPMGMLSPANRTGPSWRGMRYGVTTSPFGTSGYSAPPFGVGSCSALKIANVTSAMSDRRDGFNFSATGMSKPREAAERAEWKRALEFFNATGVPDLAYNGFFRGNDLATVGKLAGYAKPDYFSMDIECWPELEAYVAVADKSANFASAKRAGESNSAAAMRLAQSWIADAVAAATATSPGVKAYLYDLGALYDGGFQITSWPAAAKAGLADTPSYYSYMNSLDVLAAAVRAERLAVGPSVELEPWVTPGQTGGTGGPQTADPGGVMFNALIHLFCNGATGFNVYTTEGMYDGALWLAMRDAIALVTPHEDAVVDGTPAPDGTFTDIADAAVVSAMLGPATSPGAAPSALLIASSTVPHGLPTEFTARVAGAGEGWLLCDLQSGASVAVSASGAATWQASVERGSILLMAASTPCHH